MKREIMRFWIFVGMLLGTMNLWGQQAFDARAAGMAFSNGAAARGLEQVGLNPAVLGLKTSYNFEINLLSANLSVANNGFKKSEYDRYFTSGDVLTSEDIDHILNAIPDGGLRADGFARLNTLSLYMPNFSLSLVGLGVGSLNIPRDILELPLTGNNQPGRVYNFDDANGSDWASMGIYASGGYNFVLDAPALQALAVGVTLKYLAGFRYDDIVRSSGELRDFSLLERNPYVNLRGEAEVLSAGGGRGYGMDLGLLGTISQRFSVGITLLNPLGKIDWDSDPERRLLAIVGDSLTLPDRISDSLLVDSDTLIATASFSSNLPTVLDLALAFQATPSLLVTGEYEQGLNNNMGGTRRARVALGMEYSGIYGFPLRMGVNLGGVMGPSYAVGAGIDLKYWYLNLAYINHGRILPGDYKGATLALSTRLRF